MPIVTVDSGVYQRFELKSAPPDGFVMLRPLTYSLLVHRRDKALKMRMIQERAKRGAKTSQGDTQVIDLEQMGDWSMQFDFNYCIGEHNLTDAEGRLLNFNDPRQIAMTLKSLDPKVGLEIEKYIDELNNPEDEELAEDFLQRRSSSLEENNGLNMLQMDLSEQEDPEQIVT